VNVALGTVSPTLIVMNLVSLLGSRRT
jgi:hypothetical protein